MAHLLIVELPGGNDTDLLEAALRMGHSFVFLTQNLSIYQRNSNVYKWVQQASEVLESPTFHMPWLEQQVLNSHQQKPFDAILCLLDIRLVETAQLAERLGLLYVNTTSAQLLRDKFSVRERLQANGIVQPAFALATQNNAIEPAINQLGLPVLIKPSDGYGSQNILTIKTQEDLTLCREFLSQILPMAHNYGLGVRSNDRLLIERYMEGHFIGCDTFSLHGRHQLLGVNEKIMFPPPSFAIKGGCFVPNVGEWPGLERYLFSILDALDFNCGAAHIEVMITPDGPRLVEINPRLVGAKIPKLLSYALGCSVHELLIDLHLGRWPLDRLQPNQFQMAVTRWLVSDAAGVLARIDVPRVLPESIKHFEILTQPGDPVFVPFENAHRLAYVMTAHVDRSLAERAADDFIGQLKINLKNEIAH